MIYREHRGVLWASVSIPTVVMPLTWVVGLILLVAWVSVMWRVR